MNTLEQVRKAPTSKTMGIEIELIFPHYFDKDWVGFFYAGRDGSICPDHWEQRGYELVSQPLTYPWMMKEIEKLFKALPKEVTHNNSCGIHVHVSKKWCSVKKAGEIWSVLQTMDQGDIAHVFGRSSNDYCLINNKKLGSRYLAINTTNAPTVEFRMFRSGGERWATYCIECTKYMVEHAHHLSIDGLLAFRDLYKGEL